MEKTTKGRMADYVLLLPSLIPLVLVFAVPFLDGLILTLHKNGSPGWTFYNYVRFFTDSNYYDTIFRTIVLVLPAAILEMIIAFAMAYFLRRNFRGKQIINGLIIFPLTLGPLIVAVGMIGFFGPKGWLSEGLMALGIVHGPVHLLYNYWGVFISLTILGVAFIFSNLIGLMDSIDPNLEQAARSLGAGEFTTFRRVFFPLIRSGTLSIFALDLIMQLAVYESAVLVGNPASDSRVFTVVALREAMEKFNYNMGTTVAVIMAVTQGVSLLVVMAIRKRGYVGAATSFK